ncbi:MAG: hypothetical protein HYT70_00730 [Candidatus Aenigmarchaeota archaeon]|nr:hypothetical protein [Candidatus Aenigmarchaeota archaeon]
MDEETLRKLQSEYTNSKGSEKQRLWREENLRKEFVENFPIEEIPKMKLEDYVVGLPKEDGTRNIHSFCNWIENVTQESGQIWIGGSGAYVIFFEVERDGEMINSFMIREGNESTPIREDVAGEEFEKVKRMLYRMLKFGEDDNIDAVKSIYNEFKMHSHVKAKILHLYFPEMFLNVFSSYWVNSYLNSLDLQIESDAFDGRMSLMKFKQNDSIMSKWTTQQFADFLLYTFPPNIKAIKELDKKKKELIIRMKELESMFINGEKGLEDDALEYNKNLQKKIDEINKQLEEL